MIPAHTIQDINIQINNGTAKRVESACFKEGNKTSVFYLLWGSIIRKTWYTSGPKRFEKETVNFVEGNDKDLFRAHYL